MIYSTLTSYLEEALKEMPSIPAERKITLTAIADHVYTRLREGKTPKLLYVCTHNSRRSHFGQLCGKLAAVYFGFPEVNTYSAGTEVTAFNKNAIQAARRAGFSIHSQNPLVQNPIYELSFGTDEPPIVCFSKTYLDESIPKEGICAIMTCTEADGNCPFIPSSQTRMACTYEDPKAFDRTPDQDQAYDNRCKQIAIEALYIFSIVKAKRSQ